MGNETFDDAKEINAAEQMAKYMKDEMRKTNDIDAASKKAIKRYLKWEKKGNEFE